MRTAIVHFQDDGVFQQLSVFARIVELDPECNLWLAVAEPLMSEIVAPAAFDVLLNYYMEGVSFDLDILGRASICEDDSMIKQYSGNAGIGKPGKQLLLKVEIVDIDYWEYSVPIIKRIARKLLQGFSSPFAESSTAIRQTVDQHFT
ncbi:MAG TPA: hypothetical protein VL307_14970 [Chitinophagaceae bacterium]|nr:hypothetical protein [Chitinophagaceae bacterium]